MKKILNAVIVTLLCVMTSSAQKLILNKQHGFYDQPFELTISTDEPVEGAAIHYTLDGSKPTGKSTTYSSPLRIEHNTILRAAIIGTDGSTLDSTAVTYLYLDDVLHQTDHPKGYPDTWGAFTTIDGIAPADYGMDGEMTGNPVLAKKIREGLLSIPVLSIMTDKDNLFSHENDSLRGGIYIFTGPPVGDPTGNGWTRPVTAELFGKGHDMTTSCGLRLHGGHGRLAEKNPKHSLRLVFKKEYGAKSLKYPVFGEDEPSEFSQLVLRCHFGNAWQHWSESNRQKAQYTRDVWARRMQRKMGWTSVNALYVHVFLNGMYWGMYNIAERVNDDFGKDHLGGKKKDIDVVKIEEEGGNHHEAAEGDLEAWDMMVETAAKAADNAEYYRLQGRDAEGNDDPEMEALLDINNFIDYMLINQYGGNTDWDHHNWYAIRKKGADSQGFRFLCWDSELVIDNPEEDVLKVNNGDAFPTGIFQNLLSNKAFVKRYHNRAKELLTADGFLGQKSAEEVWDSLYNNISTAIYAEAARWGDYRRDVHPYQGWPSLYTVDETYMKERNRLHTQYFPTRSAFVLDGIESLVAIDDFEPAAGWVALTPSMFRKWDGTDKDAQPLDTHVNVGWNLMANSGSGVAVAGFVNVDHDDYADISTYDKLVIRGKGDNLRILANRLVAHGQWKEIKVNFNESNPYWDKDIKGLVIPLADLKERLTSSNEKRVDDFVHLHVLKVDWGNNVYVSSIWLVPSEETSIGMIAENVVDTDGLSSSEDREIYDIHGRRQDRIANGVNIIKLADGKTIKVIR